LSATKKGKEAIRAEDLEAEMARLQDLGVHFSSPALALVSGTRAVFIHPHSTGGLLIELLEGLGRPAI
jgi:hypothetical protein